MEKSFEINVGGEDTLEFDLRTPFSEIITRLGEEFDLEDDGGEEEEQMIVLEYTLGEDVVTVMTQGGLNCYFALFNDKEARGYLGEGGLRATSCLKPRLIRKHKAYSPDHLRHTMGVMKNMKAQIMHTTSSTTTTDTIIRNQSSATSSSPPAGEEEIVLVIGTDIPLEALRDLATLQSSVVNNKTIPPHQGHSSPSLPPPSLAYSHENVMVDIEDDLDVEVLREKCLFLASSSSSSAGGELITLICRFSEEVAQLKGTKTVAGLRRYNTM